MKIKIIFKNLPGDIIVNRSSTADLTTKQTADLSTKPTFNQNVSIFSATTIYSTSTRQPDFSISTNDYTIDFTTREIKNSPTMLTNNSIIINEKLRKMSSFKTLKDSYINTSSNRVIDVKNALSEQMGLKLDTLVLFTFLDKARRLYDHEDISTFIFTKKENSSVAVFYYKIETESMRLNIEYYQNNIDKIIYDLNPQCTIYMLKFLINKKLQGSLPIWEQSIVFSSLITGGVNNGPANANELKNELEKERGIGIRDTITSQDSSIKELKDEYTLNEVIEMFSLNNSNNNNNNNEKENSTSSLILPRNNNVLNFLLVRKGAKRCSIGLDFSFSFMRNFKKIPFELDAPSYREVRDGMNIFNYCQTKECSLFLQMFVKNFGYGKFDIVRELKNIYCPICYVKNVEARSIGFVNCEWSYRGVLANKQSSVINGDGVTVDNKLYVMNEINLLPQIEKLEILIKETSINYNESDKNLFNLNIGSIINTEGSDLDPLRDIDAQFSIKRKDLFPDPSNRHKNKMKIDNLGNLYQSNDNSILNFDLNSNITDDEFRSRHNKLNKEKENLLQESYKDFNIKIENSSKNYCCFDRSKTNTASNAKNKNENIKENRNENKNEKSDLSGCSIF